MLQGTKKGEKIKGSISNMHTQDSSFHNWLLFGFFLVTPLWMVLYGNCSSQPPHLIEKLPQWLSGPSPVLPAAESPLDTKPGQTVFYAQQFLFNYWHRLTKMHKAAEA
jgi:hypothetical protein